MPAREPAHAKLNMFLKVLGKRPDGYHELHSWFAFVDLADMVSVIPSDRFSLTVEGEMAAGLAADGTDNLVLAAARSLARAAGLADNIGAALHLTKRIPVAAGLGGGSADAAATLRLLSRHWRLGWSIEQLLPLAGQLGADVPACLRSTPHLATGRGERFLADAPVAPLPLLLANPRQPLSTAHVFAKLKAPIAQAAVTQPTLEDARRLGNDLAPAALALLPALAPPLAALRDMPGCRLAALTGSGPTLFALFDTIGARDAAHAVFASSWPGFWLVSSKLIP